jgi:hypothetical protein
MLSYFREDIGLSEYFTQMFSYYPSWINQTKYEKVSYFRRGEMFYYLFQQLFARYSLERIANGLPNTEILFWDRPIKVSSFYVSISYLITFLLQFLWEKFYYITQ